MSDGTDALLARLTVLALRSTVPRRVALRDGVVLHAPDARLVDDAELERWLVTAEKPLHCAAAVEGDRLRVRIAPVASQVGWQECHDRVHGPNYLAALATELGRPAEEITICCTGRGAAIVTTLAVVRAWWADYQYAPVNVRADPLEPGRSRRTWFADADCTLEFGPALDEVPVERLRLEEP